MPLFGKSQKSPADLVKNLKDSLQNIERQQKRVSEIITQIKAMVYGTADQEPQSEQVAQLAQEMYHNNCFKLLILNLPKIDFEGRKDVVQIINNLLRRQIGTRSPTVEHINSKPEILTLLVDGYAEPNPIALNCGIILRECIRHESLARQLLEMDVFFKFFEYVTNSSFDVGSDAFSTFKELLTRHKMVSAEFLEKNYDAVFTQYQTLLHSENYVTKRQALKLLGELLLDRHNFTVMTKYISNPVNLKLMMKLLLDRSRNIQFEAFHVFKVFVANPHKPKGILEILLRNKEKLLEFLSKFHTDRSEDEQFNDEKAYLIKQIKELQPVDTAEEVASSDQSMQQTRVPGYP